MKETLAKLNKSQRQAVTHGDGPLLIVAGAGTGKTTVLVNRLAYLIVEKKVSSDSLLLLTFTEKAAGEMEERADKALPYGYTDLWINTFHSFGERVLREFGLDIGINSGFKLLTETEQWVLIKKHLALFDLDYYRPLGNPTKFISELIHHFSRLKDENISPEEYLKYANSLRPAKGRQAKGAKPGTEEAEELEAARLKELAQAYSTYNKLLLENNFLDFGDLIVYTLRLFQTRPNILEYYRQKFKYVMVDEFQDTNWAQYELVKLLAAPTDNLVVVGDDDQAIYKFRGASLSNILQFKDDYPRAQEIILTENYRSRQEILDQAYDFIQNNNPNRLESRLGISKQLQARGEVAKKVFKQTAVQYFNFETRDDEVSFTAQKIVELHEESGQDLAWSDFAILVRANDTAEAYVKELNRLGIPNLFMSWKGLYYKPLILDILAYFRLLDNYHESAALFRVLSMDIFKVPQADLVAINKMAARKVWSLYEALKNSDSIPGLSPQGQKNIKKLLDLVSRHSTLAAEAKPTKIFLTLAYDSGLLSGLDRDRDVEQFAYLNQFYQKIKRLEESEPDLRLKDFIAAMNLELEAGETGSLKLDFGDSDMVRIMTVHGSKGLEFPYVFLVNLADKKFPTIARGEKILIPDALVREKIVDSGADKTAHHLEEERRLFYVALTRAKIGLYLSSAKDYGGVREKKPSRFISEMGVTSGQIPEIILSEKNEFLRDIHYLNSRALSLSSAASSDEKYPLPDKFSFSQLAAYSTCPLQYKFAFVLKVPVQTDKVSFIFGRVLHNTLYNFLLPLLEDRHQANLFTFTKPSQKSAAISKERLLDLYEEFWQPDGYPSKEDRQLYKEKGRIALEKFWDNLSQSDQPDVMFLEKKFSFKLGSDLIKGTIDRVDKLPDGTLEIIDYKTGRGKDTLKYDDKRQLILYQLFLEEFLGTKVSALSFYYLETGIKLSFKASDKDFAKLRLEMINNISAIKRREFSPTPSMMCQYCDFRDICEFRQV